MGIKIEKALRLYETNVLFNKEDFTGSAKTTFRVESGSRLIFSIQAVQLDPGATAKLIVNNGFSIDLPLVELTRLELDAAGFLTKTPDEFHNIFEVELLVENGSGHVAAAVSVMEDANSTRIKDADEDELDINPDGSLPTQDSLRHPGINTILDLTFNTPILGKVGATPKEDRAAIFMEALTKGVKWGFTADAQPFDIFKRQTMTFPFSVATPIYFNSILPTAQVSFGEV